MSSIGSSTCVGSTGLPGSRLGRADLAGLPGLALAARAGLLGRFLGPGLEATFFCGLRLPASAASPPDLCSAIAACLPCTTKLRQGGHTAA